jgi:hypothetical protein
VGLLVWAWVVAADQRLLVISEGEQSRLVEEGEVLAPAAAVVVVVPVKEVVVLLPLHLPAQAAVMGEEVRTPVPQPEIPVVLRERLRLVRCSGVS